LGKNKEKIGMIRKICIFGIGGLGGFYGVK